MTFRSPTVTRDRQQWVLQPHDMLFRMRQPSGPWRLVWAPQGGHLLSPLKHAVARPQASPALGRAPCGPRTETGKLMHGLVSQTAGPSPQTEYLGITYFEDSNADRSSALGLRLNKQNKMKKQRYTLWNQNATCVICKMLRNWDKWLHVLSWLEHWPLWFSVLQGLVAQRPAHHWAGTQVTAQGIQMTRRHDEGLRLFPQGCFGLRVEASFLPFYSLPFIRQGLI